MRYRSHCHKMVNLYFIRQEDLRNLPMQVNFFAMENATFVTHLDIDWHLNAERYENNSFFESLQKFTNLTSLELCPLLHQGRGRDAPSLQSDDYVDLIPLNFSLPKVKKLVINVQPRIGKHGVEYPNIQALVRDLIPRIVSHFPHITHLGVGNVLWGGQ